MVTPSDAGLSLYDYNASREIYSQHFPFYALIAAAARQADTDNFARLRFMFPIILDDLQSRYDAPGGVLASERVA